MISYFLVCGADIHVNRNRDDFRRSTIIIDYRKSLVQISEVGFCVGTFNILTGALTEVVIKKLFVNYCSCHQLTILSQQFEVNSVLSIIINALYLQNVAKCNLGNPSCGFFLTGVSELPLNCMWHDAGWSKGLGASPLLVCGRIFADSSWSSRIK